MLSNSAKAVEVAALFASLSLRAISYSQSQHLKYSRNPKKFQKHLLFVPPMLLRFCETNVEYEKWISRCLLVLQPGSGNEVHMEGP